MSEVANVVDQGYVDLTIDQGIGVIEFFHPLSNSLPSNLLEKLAETIKEAADITNIKVIILRSGGERTFCAGASFDELIAIKDFSTGKKFFSGFANVINAARKCPKLIIGRVHGKTVGGGVGLAAAVDYCLATKHASVKLSELAVGIGPFVVGPAVERKIGTSAMSQLAINATEWQTASWAKGKGLYAEVFETVQEMDDAIFILADKLSHSNPEAMAHLKQIFWQNTDHWDQLLIERAQTSGQLVLSEFTVNAIKAFKKK